MTEDEERAAIKDATSLLTEGKIDGPLTVVRLAEVAGLKRWKLTHKHVDLMRDFQKAIGAERIPRTETAALVAKLEAERVRSRNLVIKVRRLESILERYAVVISELTSELSESEKQSKATPIRQDIPRIPRWSEFDES
ncbi:hypothetical protein E3O47_07470 [Cryobacterium sp. TMT2-17-1]|uniref:hypothetical protein n=1 Tax=Cryobacterium sp. TMT2-17-1 TaxID=1259248 RepID=UPI00106B6F4D|nr:hypothetical protein [Cryobacterium sp. TMT2-17-1]TFC51560.1 hypothetical protein E3O47_07470 [Cryobacterium sp. TMT2-17-1]